MINIGPTTRKNDVSSLWQIIGDIWLKVRLNEYSRKYVEGMWLGNSILADERLNILLNTYDRLTQRYYQAYKGVMRLNDFSTKIIKRNRLDGFNIEYKYFFNELEDNVHYIYPPKFLTGDYRSPDLTENLFTAVIYRVYPNQNKIVLLENTIDEKYIENLKGYFFLDFQKNPFVITHINKNEIFYKKVFSEKDPSEGAMTIVRKFELEDGVDYKTEIEKDFIIFRFKNFNFINRDYNILNFFDQPDTYLYGFDIPYIDSFCEINFGYPLGLTDNDFRILNKSGLTWPEINQIIFDIWKIDQKVYGFDQIYRYAALLSGNEISRGMIEPLYLFENKIELGVVLLARSKNLTIAEVISDKALPNLVISKNNIIVTGKNKYLKISSYVLNDISLNDPIILDKETYYAKRCIDNTFIELDREVVNHPIVNMINILDKDSLKAYSLDNYGLPELNTYLTLPNGEKSNLSDILDVTSTIPWGELPWGGFNFGSLYYQQINPKCRFKPLEIGKEYSFGDCFQPFVLPNFYYAYEPDTAGTERMKYLTTDNISRGHPLILKDPNKNIPNYYIQKQLALDNKEFTENNFKEYSLNKTLLLLPFFNYSEKEDIEENNLFSVRSDWEYWIGDGTWSNEYIYNDFYKYTSIKTYPVKETDFISIRHKINIFEKNKTGLSLLRLFLRLKKGKIHIGIGTNTNFINDDNKYIFQEKKILDNVAPKWEFINVLVDTSLLNNNLQYYINLASQGDAEYDVFGFQFYKNIPSYFEKLFKNKDILGKLISSNNYKLINLI